MDRAIDELLRHLDHRVRAHQAALAMAAALGWPVVLSQQVTATRAAIREVEDVLRVLGATPNTPPGA